jgi:hypothetical protein
MRTVMLQQQDERQRKTEGTGMTPITDWSPDHNYVGKYSVSSVLEILPIYLHICRLLWVNIRL